MRLLIVAVGICTLAIGNQARGQPTPKEKFTESTTSTYSQKTLLKNWALAVCLASISKDADAKEDAAVTASAYLEFGRQPIEAYDQLSALAERYAKRKYGGSVPGEFNTMKCIDLFHSKELDTLAGRLSKTRP